MKYQNLISQMSLAEKCSLLSGGTQFMTKSLSRLGIKPFFLSDGPHGVRKQAGAADHLGLNPSLPATCYPVAAAIANSWDTGLAEQVGEHLGTEAVSQGVSVLLGPGLNIKRNPLCGRNFEYFSEDPFLSGKMAAAYIRGIQSKGAAACPKHFAVNSQETFRMASDSIVDERTLREIYLTGFEIAVQEGKPKCLMSSYNLVNGEYANDSKRLLDDILRREWGFDGMVVTDWGGSNDRVAGLMAGNHLEMPATKGNSDREVAAAVRDGRLSEALLDERLDELLSVWMEIVLPEDNPPFSVEEHHNFARKAAGQSIVLLKNEDHILPLSPNTTVAVIGDFAKTPRYQGAGSSLVNCTRLDTPLTMLEDSDLSCIGFAPGFERDGSSNQQKQAEAVTLAKQAQAVLLYLGLDEIAETEGMDRSGMKLHDNQLSLLKAVSQVNSQVVVILSAGSSIEMNWDSDAKAIVHGYLGGQAGAGAMADVLTGVINPSGKLAETYPFVYGDVPNAAEFPSHQRTSQYREAIYVGYRYYDKTRTAVKYPFGYGLSYTSFTYQDLAVTEQGVTFTLTNSGTAAGAEIAQLYVAAPAGELFAAEKELKGFAKCYLRPGESRIIAIPFDNKTFRYYNVATGQYEVSGGPYRIMIGASSLDIRLCTIHHKTGTGAAIPYEKAKLPSYYSGNINQVSDSEFAALLGHKLPAAKWNADADLDRNQPIACLCHARSPLARLVFKVINHQRLKAEKRGKPDLNILFIYNMPFRGIAKMMGGMVDMRMVDAVLIIVNGHFFKGCGQLFRSWRQMRKEQRKGITQ